ncbi:hypothetical protein HPP92_012003 [Vanilla planifolia]|uniref:C2H2-type domain-containing protein n=1 Tax=Vanilla planifolia TaxID=51239 RepID=A0A835QXC4_VANPL|nr:hypothetical protein HPP92_012334 [Vanilla planifolia]KAG0483919.1 hypothetical protein HPP92_012003 [Vanilla planifolia]
MGSDTLLKPRGRKDEKEKQRMPRMWLSLKRSFQCKSEPGEVHNPKTRGHTESLLSRKPGRSGCSRSIANLKDVIHGSKRHMETPPSCSPRSIGSSELLNPITHEVVLSNSKCELRISGIIKGSHDGESGMGSTFVGTLRPGTPGPRGFLNLRCNTSSFRGAGSLASPRRSPKWLVSEREGHGFGAANHDAPVFGNYTGNVGVHQIGCTPGVSLESASVICLKCGEKFLKLETLEAHHLSKHAVTELVEGDSSRKIVEIICKTSWLKSESSCGRIDRILKVHSTQKTLSRFEEYREMVKNKANKLPKKHPRCLADGNELLRFHGTTIACNLGINGSSSLCGSEKCNVCRIIKHGFSTKEELKGGVGVFTTSTSVKAFESIEVHVDDLLVNKALLVCRVIAGRVHKPLENLQEIAGQSGFDSLAGKVGIYSNIEELYLLNPRALLPCFVVICKF